MPRFTTQAALKHNVTTITGDKIAPDKQNANELELELQDLVAATKKVLESQGVIVPLECEKFILRCLRVKNYDIQKATTLLMNFGKMMRLPEMKNVISNLSPTLLRGMYEKKIVYPLVKRGKKGQVIIAAHASNWNPSKYDFDQAIAALFMLYNFCVANSLQAQEEGIIFILDFKGWSIKLLRAMKLSQIRMSVQVMQSCTPAKIKAFHFINYPSVVKVILTLMRPFLNSKMLDRVRMFAKIHLHGDGTTSFREELEFLPESLGGVAKEDGVDWLFLELLYQQEQYHQDILKFSYPPY